MTLRRANTLTATEKYNLSSARQHAQALIKQRQFNEALSFLDEFLIEHPDDPDLLNERGRALNNLGRLPEAARTFELAIGKSTGFALAHNNLGHVLRSMGNLKRAKKEFHRARSIDPDFARAHHNLGSIHAALKDYDLAAACFRRGLEIEPGETSAYSNLAEVLQFKGKYAEALDVYRKALEVDSERADLHAGYGALQHSFGDIDEALESYRRALELDSDNVVALAGRALLEEIMGRVEEGWSLIEPSIIAQTKDPGLLHAAGRLLRRQRRYEEALSLLLPLRERSDSFWSRNPVLYYTLGEIYDELGQFDAAFEHFTKANTLKPANFDPASHHRQIMRVSRFFSSDKLKQLPHADTCERTPVFIIGMPRSGTSLLEQILASHSHVHAGGERLELPALIKQLPSILGTEATYPDCLDVLTQGTVTDLRDRYLAGYGDIRGDATQFTDKRPWNFLHVGMIELLFPNARLVHCVRDPFDTTLSIYFQNLNARTEPYATNLDHIAEYYGEYRRMMVHWSSVSTLPIWEMRYEEMVVDQEGCTRRLLDFLEIEWEPECLQFHKSPRVVNTASYAQVRKPIYSSSVDRHANYAQHLSSIAGRLGDIAD
jgi:tetratricopeptide (TPR) repeat protein